MSQLVMRDLINIVSEGGWASTLTQDTKITPQLVADIMKLLQSDFMPRLNRFLESRDLAPAEISAPGGSATYYKRDLERQPHKEYGDVDVQFHIARIPGTSNSENDRIYMAAVKEFCDTTSDYSTENGRNVILKVGSDHVQVDLITSYYENRDWVRALAPEWNVKGVLVNSLYSSAGQVWNLSMGGGHGIQAKTVDGRLVPFKTMKNVELHTVTNNPDTWAVDVAKYLGCTTLSPLLKKYPGTGDEVRVSDIVNSLRGIAESLEACGLGSASETLSKIRTIYLDKIHAAATSSKFEKAATPAAIAKAQATKDMLLAKSQQIADTIA